ncbi:OmpP1/FadL family transporter [Candidatus Riflebacteria bacterium]
MLKKTFFLIGFYFLTGSLFAAAFSIPEQSTRSLGLAGAMTAVVDDVSSIYFNPANTAFLKEGHYFKTTGQFNSVNAEYDRAADSISPSGYSRMQNGDRARFYPFIGVGKKNSDTDDFYGLALYSPFDFSSVWDFDGPQRYLVTENNFQTYFLTPSYAKRVSDDFSIGLGINLVYSEIQLERKFALGNRLFAMSNDISFLENPMYDSKVLVQMDDQFSLSANLGLAYKLTGNSRFGFNYRGQTNLSFSGDYRVPQVHSALSTLGASFYSKVTGGLVMPQSASLGYAYSAAHNKLFSVDLNWTDWSIVDHIFLNLAKDGNAAFKDERLNLNWNDTWALKLGYECPLGWQNFKGRVGAFYESTPVPDAHLDPGFISGNSLGLALGLSYKNAENQFEFGYSHVFIGSRDVSNSVRNPAANGSYNMARDLFGLSYLRYY